MNGKISLKYFSMFFLNSFLYITLLSLEVKINYIKGKSKNILKTNLFALEFIDFKDAVKSVLRISSAHNKAKGGPQI